MKKIRSMGPPALCALLLLGLAAGPAFAKELRGYSMLEALDEVNGIVQLKGERYQLTASTRYENEFGTSGSLKDFEASESVLGGLGFDTSKGSAVYFEVEAAEDDDDDDGGGLGRVKLLRLLRELPS